MGEQCRHPAQMKVLHDFHPGEVACPFCQVVQEARLPRAAEQQNAGSQLPGYFAAQRCEMFDGPSLEIVRAPGEIATKPSVNW